MSFTTFALGNTLSSWLWPQNGEKPDNHTVLLDFIEKFIFPHENEYEKGHDGDFNYVIAETVKGDAGGTTKWGIDARSHPGVDIINLTQEQATAIYLTEFAAVHWALPGTDGPALTEFPFPAAFAFFDCREVCGLTASWLCTQKALGLDQDGIPGILTRNAILSAPPQTLTSSVIDERIAYHKLISLKGSNAQFLQGWLNRCADLRVYLNNLKPIA